MKELITQFYPYAKKQLGFDKDARVVLRKDIENAKNPLGMTGHYDPSNHTIVLYTANRHPKDILRSLAHELTHHTQNCRGEFEGGIAGVQGYAQNNPHLRNMELEAYLGSVLVRDWEDTIKGENTQMSQKITVTEQQLREMVHEILNNFSKEKKKYQKQNIELDESLDVQEGKELKKETEKSDKEWFNDTLQDFLVEKFVKK
tara:strand:- start:2275 stop:2880 length:606 start_codon:yes stop_codon:yes gene_type:complete